MPNYGDATYWNQRYEEDKDSPFDWLFDFSELQEIIEYLLPQKNLKTLLVGSGNAPFSPDLYSKGKYTNLINIDLSSVAINTQAEKYPEQQWMVMDVLNMTFPDNYFPVVLDKSLVDTLLCYTESGKKTQQMIDEIYRVLAPGSRYVTFSLHSIEEVIDKFTNKKYNWNVRAYRVKSSRWNDKNNRRRAVAHTMIVCDKPDHQGNYPFRSLDSVPGVLSEEEFAVLNSKWKKVNLTAALNSMTIDQLRYTLFHAINKSDSFYQANSSLLYRDLMSELRSSKWINNRFEEVKGLCLAAVESAEEPNEKM